MSMLFLDIETVSDDTLDPAILEQGKLHHKEKMNFLSPYNKIICICVGLLQQDDTLKTKVLSGNESEIITAFYELANRDNIKQFCGYNIMNFDFKMIVERGMKHNIPVPPKLKFYGIKPWDISGRVIDLARAIQSLGLSMMRLEDVCTLLDIPTPKGIMHGSEVQGFFDSGQLPLIEEYCRHDVQATALIYQRFKDLNFL